MLDSGIMRVLDLGMKEGAMYRFRKVAVSKSSGYIETVRDSQRDQSMKLRLQVFSSLWSTYEHRTPSHGSGSAVHSPLVIDTRHLGGIAPAPANPGSSDQRRPEKTPPLANHSIGRIKVNLADFKHHPAAIGSGVPMLNVFERRVGGCRQDK